MADLAALIADEHAIGLEHGGEGMQRLFDRSGFDRSEVQEVASARLDYLTTQLSLTDAIARSDAQMLAVCLMVLWMDGFVMGALATQKQNTMEEDHAE